MIAYLGNVGRAVLAKFQNSASLMIGRVWHLIIEQLHSCKETHNGSIRNPCWKSQDNRHKSLIKRKYCIDNIKSHNLASKITRICS